MVAAWAAIALFAVASATVCAHAGVPIADVAAVDSLALFQRKASVSFSRPPHTSTPSAHEPSPACEGDASTHDSRLLLLTLVPTHHSSTALESVLMSSAKVATLCSSGLWQCEGRAIMMETGGFDDHGLWFPSLVQNYSLGWNFSVALDAFSRYWDLSRPVLLEKSPRNMLAIREVHEGFLGATLPHRFTSLGVTRLRQAYVMLWRPICLHVLSSQAMRQVRQSSREKFAALELEYLEQLVEDHRYLTEAGEHVLVVNLADLIWRGEQTMGRLARFLPCAGPFDYDFIPRLGVDIFEGNNWKAPLSVRSFGQSVDPHDCCGYSMERLSCGSDNANLFSGHLESGLLRRARGAVAYMQRYS